MKELHGYRIDDDKWVSSVSGKTNLAVVDDSTYKIIRLNWPRIREGVGNSEALEWLDVHQEIMELIPEEKKTELSIPIDIFDEDGSIYIVYKEQDGIRLSLDDINALEKREKIEVLLKVATAIKTLHENSIIHGDLSPSCIKVYKGYDTSIQIQIEGFENYFFENSQCRIIYPCSHDLWLSPEMALYQKSLDKDSVESRRYSQYIFNATDTFSLGLIFHQYCSESGDLPIYTKDYPWQDFILGKVPLVVLDGEFRELISDMLECEPSNRPPMGVVFQRLQEIHRKAADNIGETEVIPHDGGICDKNDDIDSVEQDMLCDIKYYDLIFVINVAERTSDWLNKTCKELLKIAHRLTFKMYEAGKEVLPIRAKIIWYGDIYIDGSDAIRETEYVWIPENLDLLEKYMQSVSIISGSEKPESGLEALCLATERLAESSAKNGMIILCSEFGAYDLDILEKRGAEYTSKVRPWNTHEFIMGWNEESLMADMLGAIHPTDVHLYGPHDMDAWRYCGCTNQNRFLILLTPSKYPWSEFEYELDRCIRIERLEDAMKYGIESINNTQVCNMFRGETKELFEEVEDMTIYVDMVMVIDVTQDSPFVGERSKWQKFLMKIYREICCNSSGHKVNIRIKVMYFRDFYFDGKNSFGESVFFEIPKDLNRVLDCIDSLHATGGGDIPESGLEALWLAMHTEYGEDSRYRRRRIITLFTDASAHPLEDYEEFALIDNRQKCCYQADFPKQMPHNLSDFYKAWEDWQQHSVAGLAIVAPVGEYPWDDMEIECSWVARFDLEEFQEPDDLMNFYRMVVEDD